MSKVFHLNLSTCGLGFTIAGGVDAPLEDGSTAIVVRDIHECGAARKAGLHVGDKLISVNHKPLVNVTHQDAVELIKDAIPSQHVTLEVDRANMMSDVTVDKGDGAAADRLTLARKAFEAHDPELSRLAHELGAAPERHQTEAGQYVKAAVFGGMDGIVTTFAVVASVNGADLATGVVIIMGFANLIADGISMGMGEFMSALSESQYTLSERVREEWEFDHNPEGEIKEMVDLYMEKGFSEEEATQIMTIMAKHREFFIDHMMVEELGLMPPDEGESPAKNGLVMFLSFVAFGLVPLLSYLALSTVDFGSNKSDALFGIACAMTAVALFILGAVKSRFSTQSWYMSGFSVVINGAVSAGAAYLVGLGLENLVSLNDCP
ncbi:vacuolar iron family transporter [Salpingoeca rosetta]|uniref:Vacuolar iron family transporter n=1 Tax=Salpingoeca rosetta (strain ATCC 50818 / BSB-021) TaxID=946362 RepID=F2TWE3_SALR5|nr:vacuolar iron family transporter [Salpingoeca rosetta]EGD72389.1 vacuolar iron family transporter [Salpingoeca rosetta]|eukprot:XP_004998958.1 vacuolar iron family transporter [Salpingoeca rosetta]